MIKRVIRNRKLLKYCFEVYIDLAISKFKIIFYPYRWYAKQYGYPQCETLHENMQTSFEEISAIKTVLRVVPRFVPWPSKCLDQAMAAQRMLSRRGLQNTLYFGMVRESDKSLTAHAWLRCGKHKVVGYHPHINYTVINTYAWLK